MSDKECMAEGLAQCRYKALCTSNIRKLANTAAPFFVADKPINTKFIQPSISCESC